MKEGWVLSVPYDAKHGVGTPYLKPAEGSSSSKGNRTIKRYMITPFRYPGAVHGMEKRKKNSKINKQTNKQTKGRERLETMPNSKLIAHFVLLSVQDTSTYCTVLINFKIMHISKLKYNS